MKRTKPRGPLALGLTLALVAWRSVSGTPDAAAFAPQAPEALIGAEVMAVAYSGYRDGQHPDRGAGAVNPTRGQILEDLRLLAGAGFRLIRLYDTSENTRQVLEVIESEGLDLKVLLGIWLRAEVSNHEGCPWLDEPIPPAQLRANRAENAAEIARGIDLAQRHGTTVVAVNVGNEALVEWNDHMVPVERVIAYVERVRAAIGQPVTVAENYDWWRRHGAGLAAAVDFIGIHSYPQWEGRAVDAALPFTVENITAVRQALGSDRPVAVLEAGWASRADEFGGRASEAAQRRYYQDLRRWASQANVTVFFFEGFDEPWKGDPARPSGAEKHWGVFAADRSPKALARMLQRESAEMAGKAGTDADATTRPVN